MHLVRFAAAIARGYEPELRNARRRSRPRRPKPWVEELLLSSGAGRLSGDPDRLRGVAEGGTGSGAAVDPDADYKRCRVTRRGEETCARIYGDNYRKLRENIKELHPAMDPGW
jgi:4-carboxymuconolactone decarboxylase